MLRQKIKREDGVGPTLVLGVIGSDVHSIGNKILEHAFQEAGFRVINIGVMSSQEEFIQAAGENSAKAIIVSSLYGHAELDCRGFRENCIRAGIGNILLYIGGNISIGKQDWFQVEKHFQEIGFNRVYPPGTLPEKVIADLKKDLKLEEK